MVSERCQDIPIFLRSPSASPPSNPTTRCSFFTLFSVHQHHSNNRQLEMGEGKCRWLEAEETISFCSLISTSSNPRNAISFLSFSILPLRTPMNSLRKQASSKGREGMEGELRQGRLSLLSVSLTFPYNVSMLSCSSHFQPHWHKRQMQEGKRNERTVNGSRLDFSYHCIRQLSSSTPKRGMRLVFLSVLLRASLQDTETSP